ncbi:MAG TPA: hypothetical protein VIR33_13060 [Thermopolyspora sp.]
MSASRPEKAAAAAMAKKPARDSLTAVSWASRSLRRAPVSGIATGSAFR